MWDRGYPGMPEVGNMGIPAKLLREGVEDMVRISDGRMSGTAFGTVILHVAPEAAIGGTLALVENGDWIELDVANRRLHLDVPEKSWPAAAPGNRPSSPTPNGAMPSLHPACATGGPRC
ncbi:MAG: dihydroxy-acid dehydratase [Caldilineaceae bacterium]